MERLPFCGCPSYLQPSVPAWKMEEGKEKGLDWMSSFLFEVLHLYLPLSSFPLAPLDGQELTKSLESPRESEQFYAAQVRGGKSGGAWSQELAGLGRRKLLGGRSRGGRWYSKAKLQLCPEDSNSLGWCSRALPFPPPLFLQALGCLGVSEQFVMEALWQVVSLGPHEAHERRKRGLRCVEHGHRQGLPGCNDAGSDAVRRELPVCGM